MAATATSLPLALVYLIIFALQGFGAGAVDADYLQDGVPVLSLHAEADVERGTSVIRIDPEPGRATDAQIDSDERIVIRVEQSELVARNFLVYLEPGGLPAVVSLGPLLEQLAVARPAVDATLEVPDAADLAAGGVDLSLGSTLHILRRGETIVVSAPDPGIVLLIHQP